MKKQRLIILFAFTVTIHSATPDLIREHIAQEVLITAATQSYTTYPDADVLLIDDITRIRYETNGSYHYTSDVAFKILTEKGRQNLSSIAMGYNASYGWLRFDGAEVIKPDEGICPIDLDHQIREAINQEQMNANIYNPDSKTITLSIPDLGIGDVLRYTISGKRVKAVVPDTWSDLFTLEDTYPILHSVYEINAPTSCPLTRIELKDEIPGSVTFREEKKDDRILYFWDINNVPQLFKEPGMPATHTVAQRLLLSTIPDWEGLSKWYWELSKPHLETEDNALTDKVKELTAGLTNRQEQIEALFRFVSQEIRYMGITIEDEAPGYEPHDVSLTFNNRYGVCRDKAALLVAMLRLVGFDAYPVLIYVGPKKDPEVPQPWFNHAITAIRDQNGQYQLMDATNENTRDLLPAYLSNRSYLVASPDGETLKTSAIIPPEKNLLSIDINAELDPENRINGEAVLQFEGINDTVVRGRLAGLKPEERIPYFENRLKQALGGVRLLELIITPEKIRDTTVPLSVILRFEIENALANGPHDALLRMPTLINHFGLFERLLGGAIGLDKRRYPLQTQVTCGVVETVRLDISRSGLNPIAVPVYETVDTPELTIRRHITETNHLLIGRADLLLRTVKFSPEEYLLLKQNLKTAERDARKRVILKHDRYPPDADIVTLDEKVCYTIYDPHNWKEERHVRKKILTYAGKKKIADLKIAYNPADQHVVLNAATVTAADGTIQQIDPATEIHIMDSKWSSDAPRYPAEKILVANLPGVKIDSIIDIQLTRVYKNQPFFSTLESFGGFNPLLQKTVQLNAPFAMRFDFCTTTRGIQKRVFQKNNRTVYEWTSKNCPRVQKESHLPPSWMIRPTLLLSGGSVKHYATIVEKTLRKAAKADKMTAKKVRELTKGSKTRLEKIKRVRDFVDRNIRKAGPGFSALPLSAVTPVDQILKEGYGNTTDRAVLLYALLNAIKLKPRFILSSDLPRVDASQSLPAKILQKNAFNTLLIAVNLDKKTTIYLGDSGQYAQLGTLFHAGRPSIDLTSDTLKIPQTSLSNRIDTLFSVTLTETGNAEFRTQMTFNGTAFESFHKMFAEFTPEKRRREHQNLLCQLSQNAQAVGTLQTEFSPMGTLKFSAQVPSYAVHDGEYLYFTLPGGLNGLLNLQASRRKNSFYIKNPINKTFQYSIHLPDGWNPVLVPESFRTELPDNGGFVEVSTMIEKDQLIILQKAELNATVISVEKYDQLLRLNDQLTNPSAYSILLQNPNVTIEQ